MHRLRQQNTALTFKDGKEIEIAQLSTEGELSKSLGSSLLFANVACSTTTGAKIKANYNVILFVNTSGEDRLGMYRQTWNLFTKKLTQCEKNFQFICCCTTLKLGMKVSLGDTKNILKQKHNCAKGAKDISKKVFIKNY